MTLKIKTSGLKKDWNISRSLLQKAAIYVSQIAQINTENTVFNAKYVNDALITKFHAEYLNDPSPTDVISFHMDEEDPQTGEYLLGDLIISHETAQKEAQKRKTPIGREILLYTMHGFLHLLGYEDNTPASKKEMDRIQNLALKKFFK